MRHFALINLLTPKEHGNVGLPGWAKHPFVLFGRAFNVLPKEVVNILLLKYVVSCDGAIIRDLSTQTVLHESTVTKGRRRFVSKSRTIL